MAKFQCPYLKADVELGEERERHIEERHPDLLPQHHAKIADTLAKPDEVRRSSRFAQARMFSKWYNDIRTGRHVVVVVVSDMETAGRHWIIRPILRRNWWEGSRNGRKAEF